MANPRGNPKSLNVVPLSDAEQSRPVRVRAETWVFDALKGMSAAEIGQLISTALHDKETALRGSQPNLSPEPRNVDTLSRNAIGESRKKGSRGEEPDGAGAGAAGAVVSREGHKRLSGKGLELLTLLQTEGAVMVADGNRYRVVIGTQDAGNHAGATGGALLTRGLLVQIEPGKWRLASHEQDASEN